MIILKSGQNDAKAICLSHNTQGMHIIYISYVNITYHFLSGLMINLVNHKSQKISKNQKNSSIFIPWNTYN